MVVASATDDDGNQVYPRKWNHEFIDMPVVEQSEQNRPSFSSEIMTGLAKYRRPREQMVFIVAAAGGLRIGEALGIEIDKHLSPDCSVLSIKQKARQGRLEGRLKTPSAIWQVDLHPDVSRLLRAFINTRKNGLLFQTRTRKPLSLSNILRRHLHPARKKLGYVNPSKGDHKAGSHALRRFRNTYLKMKPHVPRVFATTGWATRVIYGRSLRHGEGQHGVQKEEGRRVRYRLRTAVLGISCTECTEKGA